MSDEIRVNRAVPQQPAMSPVMQPAEGAVAVKASKLPWIILAVVVIVLVVIGILFRDNLFAKKKDQTKTAPVAAASGYQAVFLTNGQVYFGKVSNKNGDWMTLKDIYYLQVIQPPLQGQQQPGQTAPAPQPQISLVKLGNELHGPVDEMQISRPQVLFFEDLKEDSQVVKAIKDYKANPQGTAPAPAPVK
jgi:hypothetical protein